MKSEGLVQRLKEIVGNRAGVSPQDVTDGMRFADQLSMDAMDVSELIMDTEMRLNIDLPMNVINMNSTFGYFCEAVGKIVP